MIGLGPASVDRLDLDADEPRSRAASDASTIVLSDYLDRADNPQSEAGTSETSETCEGPDSRRPELGVELGRCEPSVLFRFPSIAIDHVLREQREQREREQLFAHPYGLVTVGVTKPGSHGVDHGGASSADQGGTSSAGPNVLHACVHCHASKTACTDCRPCGRCVRLGIECLSDRDEPRKRACKGCHAGKVACKFRDGAERCNRCERLGIPCIPRSTPLPAEGARKRRRFAPKPADDLVGYTAEGNADSASPERCGPPDGVSGGLDNTLSVVASLLQLSQDASR